MDYPVMEMYKDLLSMRILEEKLIELYALGKIPGHIHSGVGEEASYAGVLATRKSGDYFKFTHRNVSTVNAVGMSYRTIFAEILGKMGGNSGGRGGINHLAELNKGIIGMAGALGGDIPVAVGVGYSIKMAERDNIVYCFLGDGTTSRGPVHEGMNWAAAWKLPVLFIVNNNQWSIATHICETCNVENPGADRGAAYGISSKVADATDILAVYESARELVAQIRDGGGPAILETKCYRLRGHFEGDQAKYRDARITEEWQKKDCLKNLEKYMKDKKLITDGEIEAMHSDILAQVEDGIAFAEAASDPAVEDIYDNLYA
jgi:pyruvate dehydrogenase E1 component alpha subunit